MSETNSPSVFKIKAAIVMGDDQDQAASVLMDSASTRTPSNAQRTEHWSRARALFSVVRVMPIRRRGIIF